MIETSYKMIKSSEHEKSGSYSNYKFPNFLICLKLDNSGPCECAYLVPDLSPESPASVLARRSSDLNKLFSSLACKTKQNRCCITEIFNTSSFITNDPL